MNINDYLTDYLTTTRVYRQVKFSVAFVCLTIYMITLKHLHSGT